MIVRTGEPHRSAGPETMGIFNRKPRIKALARAGNVDGLIEATRFRDIVPTGEGSVIDQGLRTRVAALYALRDLGPEHGAEAVAAALSDPEDRVRTAAIVVLFERSQPAPIANALRWLPAEENSRRLAFRALLELREAGSAALLAEALTHLEAQQPIPEDEIGAFDQLLAGEGKNGSNEDVLEQLGAAMGDEDDHIGDRAAQLLVRMAPASVDLLLGVLPEPTAGYRAALALGKIKDVRALEPLIETLEGGDNRARAASAAALGELRDPGAVEPLLRATQDSEYAVRARAGSALDLLGTVAVVVGISALLRPELDNALEPGSEVAGEIEPRSSSGEGPNGRAVANATTLERVARLLEGLGTAGHSGVY